MAGGLAPKYPVYQATATPTPTTATPTPTPIPMVTPSDPSDGDAGGGEGGWGGGKGGAPNSEHTLIFFVLMVTPVRGGGEGGVVAS